MDLSIDLSSVDFDNDLSDWIGIPEKFVGQQNAYLHGMAFGWERAEFSSLPDSKKHSERYLEARAAGHDAGRNLRILMSSSRISVQEIKTFGIVIDEFNLPSLHDAPLKKKRAKKVQPTTETKKRMELRPICRIMRRVRAEASKKIASAPPPVVQSRYHEVEYEVKVVTDTIQSATTRDSKREARRDVLRELRAATEILNHGVDAPMLLMDALEMDVRASIPFDWSENIQSTERIPRASPSVMAAGTSRRNANDVPAQSVGDEQIRWTRALALSAIPPRIEGFSEWIDNTNRARPRIMSGYNGRIRLQILSAHAPRSSDTMELGDASLITSREWRDAILRYSLPHRG